MNIAAHILVHGVVQGVGYRYFIAMKAEECGLYGYVKNLIDEDVEIVVEGDRSLIEELIKAAKVGPRLARVADLKVQWQQPEQRYSKFFIC